MEYIEGIEVIKAFGRVGTFYEKYEKAILDYKKFVVKWLSSTWITMKNDIRPVSIDTAWNFACGTVSDDAWSVDHIGCKLTLFVLGIII